MNEPTATCHPVRPWQLGWRQLRRDFRAGELRLLVVAVTLAVAALTAVGFFADRINGGLARDARQLLGGDADRRQRPAGTAGLRGQGPRARPGDRDAPPTSRAWAAPPTRKGGATRLVSVKAVSEAYPLRGKLRLRAGAATQPGEDGEAPGTGHGLGRCGGARLAAVCRSATRCCSATPACRGPRDRDRARPRRRLHQLRAARDAQRGRPRRPPA